MSHKPNRVRHVFMPRILDESEVGFHEGILQKREVIDRTRILNGVAGK